LQAASDHSVKLRLVLTYLQSSMIKNKTGHIAWSSFDENRKGYFV